ncbi:MAG: ATP-binding cassette domain-containing protein [Propionibacteriaceae bacterium]|jgi:ABC-type glutathione transport system ATPase component|nr:ATP-binding cassette domain-containing protein [Propionibacteriaceae bacterium]
MSTAVSSADSTPIIELRNVSKVFLGSVTALDDVSLQVFPGETVGVVGESGSGKTTLSKVALLLEEPTSGEMRLLGEPISLSKESRNKLRGVVHAVFQDPYSSLNPRFTVRQTLLEPLGPLGIKGDEAKERIMQALADVELSEGDLRKYPAQFSGGQRQRICIARALVGRPSLIILDEPTSSLDALVQAKVLNLLLKLQAERNVAYLFITHDLGVVNRVADRIAVMQHGVVVEQGLSAQVLRNPEHPYTKQLLASVPRVKGDS